MHYFVLRKKLVSLQGMVWSSHTWSLAKTDRLGLSVNSNLLTRSFRSAFAPYTSLILAPFQACDFSSLGPIIVIRESGLIVHSQRDWIHTSYTTTKVLAGSLSLRLGKEMATCETSRLRKLSFGIADHNIVWIEVG